MKQILVGTLSKIAVVTGGNRGLGYALVKALCLRLGSDATVYLAARDLQRGRGAMEKLIGEGVRPELVALDIASNESVAEFAEVMRSRHGGIDIVIGNAAMIPPADQMQQVDAFINTNNLGTHRLIRACRPLLKDGARYLTVASRHGLLTEPKPALSKASSDEETKRADMAREEAKKKYFNVTSFRMSAENRRRFYAEHATLESIEQTLEAFRLSFKRGTAVQDGWPDWINLPSKAGQVAATLVFAREMEQEAKRRDILINACCPGFVATESSRGVYGDTSLALPPDDAAENLAWAVTLPPGTTEPYGRMLFGRQAVQVHD
jgi:carbonyl reductase 1